MKVYIEKENKTVVVKKKLSDGNKLLSHLKINPSTVLIVRNDEVLLSDDALSESDEIKLISVVSGG